MPTDGVIVIGVCTVIATGVVGRGLPRRSGRLVETALHAAAGEHRVVGGSHQLAGDRRTVLARRLLVARVDRDPLAGQPEAQLRRRVDAHRCAMRLTSAALRSRMFSTPLPAPRISETLPMT